MGSFVSVAVQASDLVRLLSVLRGILITVLSAAV